MKDHAAATGIDVLHDAAKKLGAIDREADVVAALVDIAIANAGTSRASALVDGGDGWLRLQVERGDAFAVSTLASAAIPRHCVAHLGHELSVDELVDVDAALRAHLRSHHMVPIEARGAVIGLLLLDGSAHFDTRVRTLLCAIGSIAGTAIARLRQQERALLEERRRGRLARFFSPAVARHLMDRVDVGPGMAARREATVLFSDVRGFTTVSDARDPPEVLELLNVYFGRMIALVFDAGGMVDKLLGDGLLAVFGALGDEHDHAARAIACAQRMVEEAAALDVRRFGLERLTIGVGLHTGPVVVGSVGADDFLDFTVLGGTVNVAARLESLTKEHGASVLASGAAVAAAGVKGADLGALAIRGVKAPLRVFRLV